MSKGKSDLSNHCSTASLSTPIVLTKGLVADWDFPRTWINGDSEFELVIQDPKNEKHVEFVKALDRNIVQDLISSFIFQIAREYDRQFTTFLGDDWYKHCKELVDIFVKQKVCSSEEDGWLAVAPIILARKLKY